MNRVESKLERIWMGRKLTALIVFAALCAVVCLCLRHPLPGISVAVLGSAAAIMSLRPKMGLPEKASWMIIIAILLFAEVHSIRSDRVRNDAQNLKDRQTQNEAFKKVLDTERQAIATSLDGFKQEEDKNRSILQEEKRNADLAQQSLVNVTGGNSFAVVVPAVGTGGDVIPLTIKSRGVNILTGVTVMIARSGIFIRATQDDILDAVNKRLFIGTLHPAESMIIDRQINFPPTLPNGPAQELYVMIAAQNFTCEEFLEFRKIGKNTSGTSSWEYKYKVYRMNYSPSRTGGKKKSPILEETDWTSSIDPTLKLSKRP